MELDDFLSTDLSVAEVPPFLGDSSSYRRVSTRTAKSMISAVLTN